MLRGTERRKRGGGALLLIYADCINVDIKNSFLFCLYLNSFNAPKKYVSLKHLFNCFIITELTLLLMLCYVMFVMLSMLELDMVKISGHEEGLMCFSSSMNWLTKPDPKPG